jgi:N-acetylglucosamine-6-phosphate deacetylase
VITPGGVIADAWVHVDGEVIVSVGPGRPAVDAPMVDDLFEQLSWAAELVRRGPTPRGHVLGSHLEGPFLSPRRSGAQNEAHMIAPDTQGAMCIRRSSAS